MVSRIYDPVLYPSQPNLLGDLRADAIRLIQRVEELREVLWEIHEFHCGCEVPGSPAHCVCEPRAEFEILQFYPPHAAGAASSQSGPRP